MFHKVESRCSLAASDEPVPAMIPARLEFVTELACSSGLNDNEPHDGSATAPGVAPHDGVHKHRYSDGQRHMPPVYGG